MSRISFRRFITSPLSTELAYTLSKAPFISSVFTSMSSNIFSKSPTAPATYKRITRRVLAYPDCVHFLHAVLEQGHRLRDGVADLLGAVGRLQFGGESAHLDSEPAEVDCFFPVANHVFCEHLCVLHLVLVEGLSRVSQIKVLHRRSSCARLFRPSPVSEIAFQASDLSFLNPSQHPSDRVSSTCFPFYWN